MKLKLTQIITFLFQKLKDYWEIYRSHFAPLLVNFFLLSNLISLFKSYWPNSDANMSDGENYIYLKANFAALTKQFHEFAKTFSDFIKKTCSFETELEKAKMELKEVKVELKEAKIELKEIKIELEDIKNTIASLSNETSTTTTENSCSVTESLSFFQDIVLFLNATAELFLCFACITLIYWVYIIVYFNYNDMFNVWIHNCQNKKKVCNK